MGFWVLLGTFALALVAVSVVFGGWFFLILVVPLVAALIAVLVRGGSSPGLSRHAQRERPELLGPGGPDDPDAR